MPTLRYKTQTHLPRLVGPSNATQREVASFPRILLCAGPAAVSLRGISPFLTIRRTAKGRETQPAGTSTCATTENAPNYLEVVPVARELSPLLWISPLRYPRGTPCLVNLRGLELTVTASATHRLLPIPLAYCEADFQLPMTGDERGN